MIFQSTTQPHCRCCAKPIKKASKQHWFNRQRDETSSYAVEHIAKPTDRAGVEKLVNGKVISLSWVYNREYVSGANVWDGLSYVDEFFCTMRCAASFGEMAAAHYPNVITQAYSNFLRKES